MVYTLAGCNPRTCGMPDRVRKELTVLIDAGKTDLQILEHLRDSRPGFLRQHLLL